MSHIRCLVLGIALQFGVAVALGAEVESPVASGHPLAEELRSIASGHTQRGTVPGLALAVVEDSSAVLVDGFGWANEKERRPMTGATPINVASVSKSVAAWGFLRFCELRSLSLDAPVLSLVPDFSLPGSRRFDPDGATIRAVLSHTAGLSTPSAPVFDAGRSLPSVESVLVRGTGGVSRLELFAPPGIGFSYSGGGYLLMQHVVEKATRGSFARFMADEVLGPVGMTSSSFRLTQDIRDSTATYYRPKRRVRKTYHLPGAAGGLYSTAEDMARFLTLYGSSPARSKLLSEASFRALLEPQAGMAFDGVDTAGSMYALGHGVWRSPAGESYLFHAGGNPGVRSFFFISPETGSGMFLVANHDHGQTAFRDLVDAWAKHYRVAPPPVF